MRAHPIYRACRERIRELERLPDLEVPADPASATRLRTLLDAANAAWLRGTDSTLFALSFITVCADGALQVEWNHRDSAVELEVPAEGPFVLSVQHADGGIEERLLSDVEGVLIALQAPEVQAAAVG